MKPSSSSSKKKKSLTTKKSNNTTGILPISIWMKPKVTSTESTSSGSSSNSSVMLANQQIEMDHKMALELQKNWHQN